MQPKNMEAQPSPKMRVLFWEGEPVLSFRPPKVVLPPGIPKQVAAYYRRLEQMWSRRWEKTVYQRACAAAHVARSRSRPFEPWTADLQTEVKQENDVLQVRWRAEEVAYGQRCTLSREDLWKLPKGTPIVPVKIKRKKAPA